MNFINILSKIKDKDTLLKMRSFIVNQENIKGISTGLMTLILLLTLKSDGNIDSFKEDNNDNIYPFFNNNLLLKNPFFYLPNQEEKPKQSVAKDIKYEYFDADYLLEFSKNPYPNHEDTPSKMNMIDFLNMSIEEQHNYILTTYHLEYEDLINAICFAKNAPTDTKESREILARPDYPEIKSLFEALTNNKINYVLTSYHLKEDELIKIVNTYLGECWLYNYTEGYVCCCSTINRTHHASWLYDVNRYFFKNAGFNIFYQISLPNQYGNYKHQNHLQYSTTYGVLDRLVLGISVNNYCNFRSANTLKYGQQLVARGNRYAGEIPEEKYVENPFIDYLEHPNYEIILHLLSGDLIIGKNPTLELTK